jgi:hypothetical protein
MGCLLPAAFWLWLAGPCPAKAASALFGGGPFYTGGTTTMNVLRASGYTTIMLWTIHVDATTGNLIFNDQLLVSHGVYVGNSSWPAQLRTLKEAPTSVNRIEVSVGSWGVNDFQSIQTLMSTYGTNTTSLLYSNFYALKTATGADAIDYDDETLYDAPTAVKFGLMLSSIGYHVTLCPYTESSFWQSTYNQLGSGIVDAVYLQCYSGGAGNDPGTWNGYFSGLKVQPGLWCLNGDCTAGSTASEVAAQMTAWRAADDIPGGFMWLYDDMLSCNNGGTPADYALAINQAVDPLTITPATGFAAPTAYNLLSLPMTTPFGLSNAAATALNWSLINTSSWITVSASSGALTAGATTSVVASLDQSVATNLALGTYSATVIFSNQTTAVGFPRVFTLNTAVANWPVALSGFNAAVLASNNASASAPGATALDIPNDYCFYQQGLSGGSRGLPWTGVFLSQCDSSTAFQLGPYGADDALVLGDTYAASGTLRLVAPESFGSLCILAASANGGGQGKFVLNFTDGTRSPAIAFNAQDWFYTVTNVAIQGFGRLRLGTGWSVEDNGDANPNLYETSVNLAALGLAKSVASITFTNPAGAGSTETTAILAVSGLSGSLPLLPPGGLAAIPGTNATAQLSWEPTVGAANYEVKQSTVSGSGYVTVGSVPGTAYTATGLANGTTYYFVVSAAGEANASTNSSPVSVEPGSYLGWAMGAGPVAYWPLNEAAGTVAHELVAGRNGTYTGGVSLTASGELAAGFPNPHRAAYYYGSGYTLIPNLIGGTNFSILFWMRTSASGGSPAWYNGEGLVDGDLAGTTGDFGVALVGAKIGFGVGNPDTTLTSIKSVNDFAWHQIIATRNAGTGLMTLYIDGEKDSSVNGPTGVRTNSTTLHVGSIASGGGYFTGYISDVALYPQALTTNQVATLYSAATGLFYNVTLTNQMSSGNLILSWPGNGRLMQSTNLAGPWSTNSTASPVTIPPVGTQMFYRVRVKS